MAQIGLSGHHVSMCMNKLRLHLTNDKPDNAPTAWHSKEELILSVLKMYCQKDVEFGTCKLKWTELKHIHRGVESMSFFNTWVTLISTTLDNSSPILA
jgi:hypothetical protein